MTVSNVDELVADDVVAVMSWSRCSHWIAVEIKDASDDGEERNKLKWLRNQLTMIWRVNKWSLLELTIPMTLMMIAPFWMFMYWLFFTNGLWYHGMWSDFVDLDNCDLKIQGKFARCDMKY